MLVEHDMDAVFALADHLTVMVNGQVIASGTPAQVRADANVQSAYLGEEDTSMAADLLIDARGLHTYYGASHILRGIDFHVARGETIGLMGRNGMGKSTLLKTLMGLVKPRGGKRRRSWAATWPAGRPTKSRSWASPTCPKAAASSAT